MRPMKYAMADRLQAQLRRECLYGTTPAAFGASAPPHLAAVAQW